MVKLLEKVTLAKEERVMNKILLVGNGFDLAHGLLTSYNDFLFLMKNWDEFKAKKGGVKRGAKILREDPFYRFLSDVSDIDEECLDKLGTIVKKNRWAKYFQNCEAEIDGWIDFEREIYPVIDLFKKIFAQKKYNKVTSGRIGQGGYTELILEKTLFDENELDIARLWDEYFAVQDVGVRVGTPYVSRQYGILKKTILKSLRQSFDEFIKGFEIYIHEFVYRKKDIPILRQIKEIGADYVISFNYTLTEKLYGISEDNVHHIHGMIRENLTSGKNNMILGVNEQENQDMDFIYFAKYFQRIQKHSGVRYKNFVNNEVRNEIGETILQEYNLYVYGHSLDETDQDILMYILNNGSIGGKINQVIVYYYDDSDYEQKVINLIKLLGRPTVEEYLENEKIIFIPTSEETV